MNAAPLPTQIGKYRVKRLLGAGGMGRVFLAVDPDIGRDVAIKLVTLGSDPQAGERFLREAQTMGRMNHPNIATLLEFGVDQGTPFLVLEFLSGEDLSQWMLRPHSLREQVQVMLDIAQAISAAHKVGVLHRDLKPENVRVLDDGRCKLLDFGIAQSGAGQLTASGYFVGTPEFVAPEVMSGLAHSTAADIYALGLLYYTMLCGDNPFRGDTVQVTVARVVQRDPPPIGTRMVGVPPPLAELIHQCLLKTPELRPQSADLVVTALHQILPQIDPATRLTEAPRTTTATATQAVVAEPARTRATAAVSTGADTAPRKGRVLAVFAGAMVGVLMWWLWPATEPVAPPPAATVTAPAPEPAREEPLAPSPPTPGASTATDPQTAAPGAGATTAPSSGATAAPSSVAVAADQTAALPTAAPMVAGAQPGKVEASTPRVEPPHAPRTEPPPSAPSPPIEATPSAPPPAAVSTAPTTAAEGVETPLTALAPEVAVIEAPVAVTVSRSSPRVLRAGRNVTMRIEGAGLAGVEAVTISFGGAPDGRFRTGALKHEGDAALEFALSVARGVPLGSYSLLLQGKGVRANPIIVEVSL